MTSIGDLLGDLGDKLIQNNIKVGDVYMLALDGSNGITPKNGDNTRDKFFVVLGFDENGDIIGGLVINSKINRNLPDILTDYYLPITVKQCPFLLYDSFVNCTNLIRAKRYKFNRNTYRGNINNKSELMKQIIETVKESPTISRKMLKEFGVIK